MPTYEYECSKCGAVTEVFHSITQPTKRKLRKADNPTCKCNAGVIRRIGSGAGVIFKGSGFYETDYRSESYKKAAKAEKESSEKPKKDADGKSDKKSTTKSDTKSDAKSDASSSKKSESASAKD